MNAKQMFDEVTKNYAHFEKFGLTTLENYKFTDGWLHSDCRVTNNDKLLIVDPL